ncbi:MAG: type VII secretion protein EccB, partial [Mycobacterium sp.]
GNDAEATTTESLWWLSFSGVRFGVPNTREVRTALGLTSEPAPAPWVALRLLAPGPTLSREDALVRHDTLPTDLNPAQLAVPR